MKKTLLIIASLLFITSTVFSQYKVNVNSLKEYGGKAFKVDDDKPYTGKVFGLDKIDRDKHIYVVEGPLDSLFLDNCLAVGGSEFSNLPKENTTIVFDNEPRNQEICNNIEESIRKEYSVCLWPVQNPHKDINDMILSGMSSSDITSQIKENTYRGTEARLRFAEWRKING